MVFVFVIWKCAGFAGPGLSFLKNMLQQLCVILGNMPIISSLLDVTLLIDSTIK